MSWLHTNRFWLTRRIVQLGILVLFWLGARSHIGVLTGNLSSARILRTVPLADPYAVLQILFTGHDLAGTVLLGAAIVLVFYFAVGGRAFCGWVCPVNLLSDFARWLVRRLRIRGQFRVDCSARFWIMALALPLSTVTGVAAFEWLSPIAMIHREIIFGAGLGLLAALMLVTLDIFVLKDGWCRSLCPLGAFYSLLGRWSPLRIGFESERCDRCGDCVVMCPEPHVIDLPQMERRGFIDSGDCSNCARCLEVCPRDAFHFTLRTGVGAANGIERGDHHATQTST